MSLYKASKLNTNSLSPLLFPSTVFGLMPCSPSSFVSNVLVLYSVLLHISYRSTYVWVLYKYIRSYEDMDLPLVGLLSTVCVFKAACPGCHIYRMIIERKKYLDLVSMCCKEDFSNNRYRLIMYAGLVLWPIPLAVRQTIDLGLVTVLYAVGGVFDIVCVFIIAMQYCTFLEIATKRFIAVNLTLHSRTYKLETATRVHNEVLNFTKLIHSLYGRTMLIEICYLGFDFIVAMYDSIQSIRLHSLLLWGVNTFLYSMGCMTTIYIVCYTCERVKKKVMYE
ncbi:Hypothetical protein NTJ_04767 [Nesidiocoris tenuis]|uniref:Gustatory receptor n=1 Tax=Nesidiocoris tenuis TaxID=355587 RepID=A0ABN7AI96_9HEMI|nr:Hypothetical protein NTJ_04767 [Nesidiocoris tenuis]